MALSEGERELVIAVRSRSEEMLADLRELVAIPTGHGFAKGLDATRELLTRRLSALGATVRRMSGGPRPDWLREGGSFSSDSADTLVASHTAGSAGGPRILISGHIDTVHDPNGPFCQLIPGSEAGTLLGPGAADMKGGLVIALAALSSLAHCAVGVRWSMVLNSDEETGSFASSDHLRECAREHDIGLVLEPAGPKGEFVTARAGSAQFRVDAFGREAHAGRDAHLGLSATALLCKSVDALMASHDASAGRTINIGPLEGGPATNIVAAHACAWGNARYRSTEQRSQVDHALSGIERGKGNEAGAVRVRTVHNRPLKEETTQVRAIAAVALGAASDLGVSAGTTSTGGVSDANLLQAAGLACLDGMGVRGGKLHTTDEFIVVSSLAERASILAVTIARLARGASVPCAQ